MTRWITDSTEACAPFVSSAAQWQEVNPEQSSDAVRGVIDAFFDQRPVCMTEDQGEDSQFPERVVAIVNEAPSSQFNRALSSGNDTVELPDGLVCLALTGKGFRGQRNRPWAAVRGNMHLTAAYSIDVPIQGSQAALTMLPAVAAAEAVEKLLPKTVRPEIKWLNDVLVQGKKLSGVLTGTHLSGGRITRAVFGIGINVKSSPEVPATSFVPGITCLADYDANLSDALPRVLQQTIQSLDRQVETLKAGDVDTLFERYANRAGFIGRVVSIWPEGTDDTTGVEPIARGVVEALNPDGSLTLTGVAKPVPSGRMIFEEH